MSTGNYPWRRTAHQCNRFVRLLSRPSTAKFQQRSYVSLRSLPPSPLQVASPFRLTRFYPAMTTVQRRRVGSQSSSSNNNDSSTHDHSHEKHSAFSHSHDHGELGQAEGAAQIIAALKGQGDRGSRVTLLGLLSNIGSWRIVALSA